MMDIINRLRNTPNWQREKYDGDWKSAVNVYDRAPFEAANQIEKLRAEVEQHRQEWDRVHHVLAKHGLHPGRTDDRLVDVIDSALTRLRSRTVTLPPLPEPLGFLEPTGRSPAFHYLARQNEDGMPVYTPDQIRTYATYALRAAGVEVEK